MMKVQGLRQWVAVAAVLTSLWPPASGLGQEKFVRGDADADGGINITDPVYVLGFLFLGGLTPPCLDAADADDSGSSAIDITDPVYLLNFLFLGGPAPPPPSSGSEFDPRNCGLDPTADELTCVVFQPCLPTTILRTSPAHGEESVSLTQGIVIDFSGPIVSETVTAEAIFVQFGGKPLRAVLRVSADQKTVRLFCNEALPASARVRVTVRGDDILGESPLLPVDADGDGQPGGTRLIDFDTVSMSRIPGTNVFGYVYASEKVGGVDQPLKNVELRVEGVTPEIKKYTDETGRFELPDVPSPEFFVYIDGAFVEPRPQGGYYPRIGKSFRSVPGQTVQVSMDHKPFTVYLPFITEESLVFVEQGKETEVRMSPSALDRCRELGLKPEDCEKIQLTVPADSLMSRDGSMGSQVAVFPVDSARLPTPLPDGLIHRFDITVQSDAEFFDTPARITFPNVENLPPRSKTLLMSFDHASNRWIVVGTMTVSDDGKLCVPDEGVGIRAPGWHNGTMPGTPASGPTNDKACKSFQEIWPGPEYLKALKALATCVNKLKDIGDLLSLDDEDKGLISALKEAIGAIGTLRKDLEKIYALYKSGQVGKAAILSLLATTDISKGVVKGAIALAESKNNDETGSLLQKWIDVVDCWNAMLTLYETPCKNVAQEPFECISFKWRFLCEVLFESLKELGPKLGDLLKLADKKFITAAKAGLIAFCNFVEAIKTYITQAAPAGGEPNARQVVNEGPDPILVDLLDRAVSELVKMDILTQESAQVSTEWPSTVLEAISQISDIHVTYFGRAHLAFVKMRQPNLLLRMKSTSSGQYEAILRGRSLTVVSVYESRAKLCGEYIGVSSSSGVVTALHGPALYECDGVDTDGDGLTDVAEDVIGTNARNADSDLDGIPDGMEISGGLNPLDGRSVATGILGSVDTPGFAVDVCALNDLAIVADSARGVSVVDVSRFQMPVIIAQVDTPGDARRVACSGNLIGVADGPAGLAIIDVTDPPAAVIRHQIRLDGAASAVAAGGGFVFAGTEAGGVYSVDLATGSILDRADLAERVYDLSLAGDCLFALTPNGIRVSCNPYEKLNVDGQLSLPGYFRLFAGNGTAACDQVAYLVHGNGYATVDVRNPKSPRLIATGSTGQIGWGHIVPTGSRFGVAAVGVNAGEGDVYLYDLSDCSRIGQFQTLFGTPGVTRAVAVYNGLAYAADGNAGLQVVNYLAYDTGRNAPTISIGTNLPQLTVEEGKLVRVTASVTDDVQVRNVEFYLNDERIFTDGSFPFEHRFLAPRLSTGPTITLRAKATDTGGNFSWSEELTVQVTKDVTPPVLRRTTPAPGGFVVPLSAVTAAFSEAMDLSTLANGGFKLFSAGPDRVRGNADDAEVPGGTVNFLEDINTAVLGFPTPLAPGAYRALVASSAKDLAGIGLATEGVWDFRVYRTVPPPMGPSAIAIAKKTASRSAASASVAVFVRHPDPLDAFNVIVDHGSLPALRYELGEDLQANSPEFVNLEEVSPGRSLLAVIIEDDPPHVFRTLDARDPIEVVRVILDLSNAQAVNPVRVVKEPFEPSGLIPEFTVNGRAVEPEEIIDGEVRNTGE